MDEAIGRRRRRSRWHQRSLTHSHARLNIATLLPLLTTSVINDLRYTLPL